MTALRALAGLLALSALPACGGGAEPAIEPAAEPVAAPAAALTVEVKQYRADIAPRRLSVSVGNPGGEPVVVTGLELLPAGFEPLDRASVDVEVPPGRRTDVKVPYGTARCEAVPQEPDRVRLDVRDPAGQAHSLELEVPVGNGLMERLRRRECAEVELRSAAGLRLAPQLTRVGLELRGPLLLERQDDDAQVTVVEPGGNILFTIRPPVPSVPLGVLEPGQERLELPMAITATRCDGHALAESKRSYVFAFFTSLDGGEPHLTTVTAAKPLQRQLDRLALDTCRPGS